jgi:hypothetical protein
MYIMIAARLEQRDRRAAAAGCVIDHRGMRLFGLMRRNSSLN